MKTGIRIILGWILVFCLAHAADHSTYYRNFWTPKYYKLPLNYCMQDGQTCGLPVATAYCRWMGYEKADHVVAAYNLGLTRYYISQMRCKHWQCSGFKTIRCLGHLRHKPPKHYAYRKAHFAYPRYQGHRVAWCADGMGNGCGHRAAYSFCRRLGYMKTLKFSREAHVGATHAIMNQRDCFGVACDGFKYIDCYR